MKIKCLVASFATACVYASASASDDVTIASIVERNFYTIEYSDDAWTGPGIDRLMEETATAQWLRIGELHNTYFLPQFVTALFERLNAAHGYNYLITEQDPIITEIAMREEYRGNRQAIHSLAKQYGTAFTFASDQELNLMADISSISGAEFEPIWGCERVFGVTHILDELIPLAPNRKARAVVEAMRAEVNEIEKQRDLPGSQYISSDDATDAIANLAAHYEDAKSKRAHKLISLMQEQLKSISLYRNLLEGIWPGGYEQNFTRERMMKELCWEKYQIAAEVDGAPPKGIIKLGRSHAWGGLSPGYMTSVGEFFDSIAITNELDTVAVLTSYDYWASGEGAPDRASFRVLEKLYPGQIGSDAWFLIDLREFRHEYYIGSYADELEPLSVGARMYFEKLIFGFDYLLFMGEPKRGEFTTTGSQY